MTKATEPTAHRTGACRARTDLETAAKYEVTAGRSRGLWDASPHFEM